MNALDRAELWRAHVPRLTFLPALEAGVALLAVLLFSQALLGPLLTDPADPESSAALRLIWPPLYLVVLVLIAARPAQTLALAIKVWPLLALLALTMISAQWSIDPGVTVRRSIAVIMTSLFGLWFAARFCWRDMIVIVASAFAVLSVGSLIASLAFPGFAVDQGIHAGAWKGLWWEKNTLGAMMNWATLAFAAAMAVDPRRRWIWLGFLLLALFLTVMATSRTGYVVGAIAAGGPLMIALARRGPGMAIAMIGAGVIGLFLTGLVLATGLEPLLKAMGRDVTFTGRTPIWSILLEHISERPWLGHGYAAYWGVDDGPVYWLRERTEWPVPTAHNAWLEVAISLGVIGVTLTAFVYLQGFMRAAGRLLTGRETYWALTFFVVYAVVGFSESNLLGQNSVGWMMFCATVAKLASGERALPAQAASRP